MQTIKCAFETIVDICCGLLFSDCLRMRLCHGLPIDIFNLIDQRNEPVFQSFHFHFEHVQLAFWGQQLLALEARRFEKLARGNGIYMCVNFRMKYLCIIYLRKCIFEQADHWNAYYNGGPPFP